MTITEAGRKLRAREVSAVELAEESLRRIKAEQPRLNAFITITEDVARAQARQADEELARGIDRGPLHGIPFALKDNFETKGIRTTCGSKLFADYIPERDCAVYEQLRERGAVLMGKTGLHELAYGITSNNPHFGAVRNPQDPTRIPGGSSGGNGAAVAADMVFFAMGSDTGGSIRIPAAFCGCVGFKPTFGLVNRRGLMPLGDSFDHAGPMTRTVEDAAIVMDLPLTNAQNLRICDTPPDLEEVNAIGRLILLAEAASVFAPYLDRRAEIGPDVLGLIEAGLQVSAVEYLEAQRRRAEIREEWQEFWKKYDVLILPTVDIEPPRVDDPAVNSQQVRVACTRLVRPFNVLGFPAVSIPRSGAGLPKSLQITGNTGNDALVLSAAAQLYRAN
ncbi:MAG TPA: amidase [Bryobacteraceae bacterium]|nr:amidase [Bryobacteraceae bacterium]